jgi:hypothetical protein
MWFNMFTVPSRAPSVGTFPLHAMAVSLVIQKHAFALIVLPAAALLIGLDGRRMWPDRSWSRWLSENPWTLPLLTGLAEFPISVYGSVRVGGATNNYSYCLYFLLLASCIVVQQLLARPRSGRMSRPFVAALAVFISLATLVGAQDVGARLIRPEHLRDDNYISYDYIKNNIGYSYFPSYPLSHLLAEGKLYHFDDGLACQELANFKISEAHFLANIPPQCERICFPPTYRFSGKWRFVE